MKVGVRGSKLALAYAQKAIDAIGEGEIEIIKTDGDLHPETPIHEIGGKGVFCNAIEYALAQGLIDVAVHSLKDMPGDVEHPDLHIGAVLRRVQQHRVKPHFHYLGSLRGQAKPGINDHRHIRILRTQALQPIAIDNPQPGANRRSPWHQHLTASIEQPVGKNNILGGVGKYLEPVLTQLPRRRYQLERIWLQRIGMANHFQLDPVCFKQLTRHLRGGDSLIGRVTTGGVWQNLYIKLAHQPPEPFASGLPGSLAPHRYRRDSSI